MRLQTGTLLSGMVLPAIAILSGLWLDPPRAFVGLLIGWACVYTPYATIALPTATILAAAIGEQLYPLIGHAGSPNWFSFFSGLAATAATAAGMFQILYCKKEEI